MPHIDAAGVKLYFEEAGQGYPIVFGHEFGSYFRAWEAQVRYFSRAYSCITFSARGYPEDEFTPAGEGVRAAPLRFNGVQQ